MARSIRTKAATGARPFWRQVLTMKYQQPRQVLPRRQHTTMALKAQYNHADAMRGSAAAIGSMMRDLQPSAMGRHPLRMFLG